MNYEFFVSIRHLSARKSQKFISLNSWISMVGVGLGVMALIVVIAVMSVLVMIYGIKSWEPILMWLFQI